MDLVKKLIEKMEVGTVICLYGVLVYRVNDIRWAVGGESVSVKAHGVDLESTLVSIKKMAAS